MVHESGLILSYIVYLFIVLLVWCPLRQRPLLSGLNWISLVLHVNICLLIQYPQFIISPELSRSFFRCAICFITFLPAVLKADLDRLEIR